MLDPGLELRRHSNDRVNLKQAILGKLVYSVGKDPHNATSHDWFFATTLAVRDRIVDGWMDAIRRAYAQDENGRTISASSS